MLQTLNSKTREHPLEISLLNWAGSKLRPLVNLSEESLLAAAQRRTGLSDWGDESFRVPLRILLKSLETEANLSFVGWIRCNES